MSATLTAMQLAEAHILLKQGWKQSSLASRYGVSPATLSRLLAKLSHCGDAAAAVAKSYAVGPRDDHELTHQERTILKYGMLAKDSRKYAAEMLMNHEDCTDETYARLEQIFDKSAETRGDEAWPMWFKRASLLTAEERASFRGPKALASFEPARPRGLYYIHEGEQHPLFANALWEFDDESENTPWAELDHEGRGQVNRQTLKAIDVYANFYLGMKAISRASDGYKVEDQADFLLELVDAHGLPMRARIERGPWDNNFWFGVPLPRRWWHTKECTDYAFGGIDSACGGPIGVLQAFKSRHKGTIEGSFNHRQTIAAHETLDIGRFRGEHEAAAKIHVTTQRLKTEEKLAAMIARLPSASARADISMNVLERFNAEAKRRRHLFGAKKVVPNELFATAVRRDLAAADRWRFLPVKVAHTIRNQTVSIKVPGHDIPFVFTGEGFKPTWDYLPYLPHGWRLFVAFHPARPDLGAHIFNALHPEHPENPGHFPLGMSLGVLPACALAPQFSDAPGDFAGRKQTMKAIGHETRIIRAAKAGVRVSTVVAAGQTRSLRKGSPDPLRDLDKGAPPVSATTAHVITPLEIPARNGGNALGQTNRENLVSSGQGDARGVADHEAPRKSAGRASPTLEELEAAFAAGF